MIKVNATVTHTVYTVLLEVTIEFCRRSFNRIQVLVVVFAVLMLFRDDPNTITADNSTKKIEDRHLPNEAAHTCQRRQTNIEMDILLTALL